jgi:integrase
VFESPLADGSICFWTKLTVGVGDRRHVTLGYSREGMDQSTASEELKRQHALVTLGQWEEARSAEPTSDEILFHVFASEWFARKRRELEPNGRADYEWRLSSHLLPFFETYRLREIDERLVDRYREAKLAEREEITARQQHGSPLRDGRGQKIRPLSNRSINMTLELLSSILAVAAEYKLIASNPARGKKRRLKEATPNRTWLMPDQVLDLIAAAERIDRVNKPATIERARQIQAIMRERDLSARQAAGELGLAWSTTKRLASLDLDEQEKSVRRAIIVALALTGLRASELCALRWRDVDFTNRRIKVPGTKTDAARRYVKMRDLLREELLRWKLDAPSTEGDDLIFPTATGAARDRGNLEKRVLAPAVREADRDRSLRDLPPLPAQLTPHSLRRTFISMLLAHRVPLPTVQREVGHKDARTTLEIYAQVMDTDFEPTGDQLTRLCAYSADRA